VPDEPGWIIQRGAADLTSRSSEREGHACRARKPKRRNGRTPSHHRDTGHRHRKSAE